MLNSKKYYTLDFLIIPLKIIPFQTIFALINTIVNSLIPAYQTLVIANFINKATDIFYRKANYSSIFMPIILIMVYIVYSNIIPSVSQIIDISGRNKLNATLRKEMILKQARLEYKHIENEDTAELINRVCTDPVDSFMSGLNNIFSAANLLISSVSLLIIVMSSNFISGLSILFASIPLFYLAMKTGRKNYEMGIEAKKIQRKYNYISDILTSRDYAEERKLFNYSSSLREKYEKLYDESCKIETEIEIKTYANMKSGSMFFLLIVLIIVALLLPSLRSGKMGLGMFVGLVNAINGLVQKMSWQLSGTMRNYARLKDYLRDFSIFTNLSEKTNACSAKCDIKDFVFDTLEFKNVSFKYPDTEKFILKNCSFKLDQNKSYSFVGVNGAGKTTIIKLLTGMYEEYDGEILINNKNIRDYKFNEIKSLISVVFQDYSKYSLTIKDNIYIGNIMKSDEDRLNNIVSEMNLTDMVSKLEFGLDTRLGKLKADSRDLSGGQWQKLAISRLLYSDAKINILDEPTAALDPITESKIYDLFSKINSKQFKIYITHRLGASRIADEILVIDNGKIVEQGPHKQLMSNINGIYCNMFNSQKSWYEFD